MTNICTAARRHPYFDVVVGLAMSYDSERYAGGSLLLVGSPMPDMSKVITQTKRDTLDLQVGGRYRVGTLFGDSSTSWSSDPAFASYRSSWSGRYYVLKTLSPGIRGG